MHNCRPVFMIVTFCALFVSGCDVCVLPVDQVFQAPPSFFILLQLFLPRLRLLRRHPLQKPSLSHGLGLQEEAESRSRVLTKVLLGTLEGCRTLLLFLLCLSLQTLLPSSAWGIFRLYLSGPSWTLIPDEKSCAPASSRAHTQSLTGIIG